MKILKSILAALAALVILTLAPTTLAKVTFTDVDETELYADAIQFLYNNKIVKGYDDGTFKPQNTINRAEMVKIIAEATLQYNNLPSAFLEDYSNKKCFTDVPTKVWYTKYVCYGKEKGWIIGYENGKYFKPANAITFVEGLKITFEGFNLNYVETSPIWYKGLVQTASASNYIPFDIYDFNSKFKRNQMADLITRILKHKESQQSLSDYLGVREALVVSYESIEQGLDLSKNQFEEKEIGPEPEPQPDPEPQPNPNPDPINPNPINSDPIIEPKVTQNPGTPFAYVDYLSMNDSSFSITMFDPLNDGGKPITHYNVYDMMSGQPKLFKILYKEGNPQNVFTFNGLTKDAQYALVVKAVNQDGLESKSGYWIDITVSKSASNYYVTKFAGMDKPGAPKVSITDQTADHITLNITPSTKGNTEYYAIEIKEVDGYIPYRILYISDFASVDDFKNGGPITFSGLTANKDYDMRIRAVDTDKLWSKEEVILKFKAAKNGFNSIL